MLLRNTFSRNPFFHWSNGLRVKRSYTDFWKQCFCVKHFLSGFCSCLCYHLLKVYTGFSVFIFLIFQFFYLAYCCFCAILFSVIHLNKTNIIYCFYNKLAVYLKSYILWLRCFYYFFLLNDKVSLWLLLNDLFIVDLLWSNDKFSEIPGCKVD